MIGIQMGTILYLLYHILMILIPIASIIVGIIIIRKKEQRTGSLGISAIIVGVYILLNSLLSIMSTLFSINILSSFYMVLGVIRLIIGVICAICIGLYAKKEYESKLVYILPAAYLGIRIINTIIMWVLNNKLSGMMDETYIFRNYQISMLTSYLADGVMALIIMYVFYKNREKESLLPDIWKYWGICVIIAAVGAVVIILEAAMGRGAITGMGEICRSLIEVGQTLMSVIIPIYIIVCLKKNGAVSNDAM